MTSSLRPWGAFLVLSVVVPWGDTGRVGAAAPTPQPRLGINLSAPKDYNTELPFVDVFRISRPWISQKQGAPWGQGPALSLDSNGWITRLAPGCYAQTMLCTIGGGHYPGGIYTVLWQGQGQLDVTGDATIVSSQPGLMQIRVTPVSGFSLRLLSTSPSNYVRNIHVIMPGFLNSYQGNPWNPQLLQRWKGVACLRFKDFMVTDNSPISKWSQRPRMRDATFWAKGVPVELLVDLANRLQTDAWFCMPHQADDTFITNFATYVRDHLNSGLKAYIEYSNETWNGGYSQHAYAAQQGQLLGLANNDSDNAAYYTALRSVQIFQIWQTVFGGTERLVRVLPSQAASSGLSKKIVTFQNAYQHADALAIAPYMGFTPSDGGNLDANVVSLWSLTQLFNFLQTQTLPAAIKWMKASKAVADSYNLKLVAYEGGQHLVGLGTAVNNATLTSLLQAANADPRMGTLYDAYLQGWERAGGDLLNHFNSVEKWSKWGSWGLLQYQDDNTAQAPKLLSVMRWATAQGQTVNVPSSQSTTVVSK